MQMLNNMENTFSRVAIGTLDGWMKNIFASIIIAVTYLVLASVISHEVVNLVPDDRFDWLVVLTSILFCIYIGYTNDGLILSWIVAGTIWFGSVYYGSMQSEINAPAPGVELALLVAIVAATIYGIPSFILGMILRVKT